MWHSRAVWDGDGIRRLLQINGYERIIITKHAEYRNELVTRSVWVGPTVRLGVFMFVTVSCRDASRDDPYSSWTFCLSFISFNESSRVLFTVDLGLVKYGKGYVAHKKQSDTSHTHSATQNLIRENAGSRGIN